MVHAAGVVIDGRYTIQSFLGSGASGEVYEVIDAHQGQTYALKLFRPVPGAPPWHEAQVLTQLESDFILPVRNADIANGLPYIVTDLAIHGSAADGTMPLGIDPSIAVRWVRAACRGATRTHDARLLHRDIKPENLFRTASGGVVLGDFGMAAFMDPHGEAGRDGTPVTVAPEVAAGGNTTVSSDVYSLGATLYALVAGRYAHNAPTKHACLDAVMTTVPPLLRDVAPHVTRGLAQRVERAMARDPNDRYDCPASFDADLGLLRAEPRRWQRTDEHIGHHGCWRSAGGGRDIVICVATSGTRFVVEGRYAATSRRVPGTLQSPVTAAQLPRRIRAAMNAIR